MRLAVSTWFVLVASCAIKLLLVQAYRSTDFAIHRSWLAITAHLPANRWYWDETEPSLTNRLDYPPLFAGFQWVLAEAARFVDPSIVALSAEPMIETPSMLLFQRASVAAADVPLFFALCAFTAATDTSGLLASAKTRTAVARCAVCCALVLLHPGLLFVDAIHFQYNSLVLSILVGSLALAYRGHALLAALALLLLALTKHLFLVLGPAAAVFCLLQYVLHGAPSVVGGIRRAAVVVGSVALCVGVAFLPFLLGEVPTDTPRPATTSFNDPGWHALTHLKQIGSRLFPFGRGLVHEYWAPNVWAFYMAADKVTAAMAGSHPATTAMRLPVADAVLHSNHQVRLQVFPRVDALVCMCVTFVAMIPVLATLWQRLRGQQKMALTVLLPKGCPRLDASHPPTAAALLFHVALVLSYGAAFAFGWHVHEKATLYVLLPALLLRSVACAHTRQCSQSSLAVRAQVEVTARELLASPGWLRLLHLGSTVCVMPLVFTPAEQPFLLLYAFAYTLALWAVTSEGFGAPSASQAPLARQSRCSAALCLLMFEGACVASCIAAVAVLQVSYAGGSALLARLPFLPLMLTSLACGVAVLSGLVWLCHVWMGLSSSHRLAE